MPSHINNWLINIRPAECELSAVSKNWYGVRFNNSIHDFQTGVYQHVMSFPRALRQRLRRGPCTSSYPSPALCHTAVYLDTYTLLQPQNVYSPTRSCCTVRHHFQSPGMYCTTLHYICWMLIFCRNFCLLLQNKINFSSNFVFLSNQLHTLRCQKTLD